jgi:hypothetical protein
MPKFTLNSGCLWRRLEAGGARGAAAIKARGLIRASAFTASLMRR